MLWTALLLGAAGSLHCAGMCGPLMFALPTGGARTGFVVGRVAYHAGRLATYTALGGIVGVLGKSLAMVGLQRWVSLTAGVLMLAGLAALIPLSATQPIFAVVRRLKQAAGRLLQNRSVGSLALLGGLNGLLPCGLVYAAAAGAASLGGILSSLSYMTLFGVGTLPMMLGLSLSGKALPVTWRTRWQQLAPVTLGLVAVLLILRGLALGIPYLSPDLGSTGGGSCH
ncbi:MAG TPA: sulfite exporter TauE/SafE family protein [Verrucomicrobiota bacterium]|nr:hypothetical protein [Verrucomicrobiales bacterium]HRI16017.1 sulfite exporter TauE/SafE family protein [Verrucomicrobiota bacterium]